MKSFFLNVLMLLVINISFGQVVINEVHVKPSGGDTDQAFQSMYNSTPTFGSEFIEIYNTSSCTPMDISCWTIGGMDGGSNGGAFSFPSGTVIAPLSFITIGGPNTIGVTFNLNLAANSARLWSSNASRWHLPNGDGWVALYDAAGTAVDAVYWTFASNDPTKLNTDGTFTGGVLQRIGTCGGGGLATASAIAGIEYISQATVTGQSYERSTDGGTTWTLGAATPNNCNGICATSTGFALNATVVQPTCSNNDGCIYFNPSPAGTYFYEWPFPTIMILDSICELAPGSYDITITESGGCTKDTTIVLTSSNGPNDVDLTNVNPGCGSSPNSGSVTINSVTGGTGPYEYNFNGLGYSSNFVYSNLTAGTYTLLVRDASGCVYTVPNIVLTGGSSLSGTIANTPNSNCTPCNYNGPSIMINEINVFPINGDGSIYGPGPNATSEGEWIELYNPNWCDSIDISGYILGSYNSTASINPSTSDGMAFVIPNNTPKVPPLGFAIVRGSNAPVPANGIVDIIVNNTNNNACIDGGIGTSRIWFQNSGGWFAFYDASGTPQDAISWGNPPNIDLNNSPCIPTNNNLPGGVTSLSSYNAIGINANLGTITQTITKVRIPDGGTWSTIATPTENFSYGTCNDPANCLTNSGISNCNGTATVTMTSGLAPFSYQWDDPAAQTSQTSLNLCAGSYNVIVTDGNNCTTNISVDILEDNFTIDADFTDPTCSNDNGEIHITTSTPGTYTYTWTPNTNISNTTSSSATSLAEGTYSVEVSAGGCVRDTTISLVAPPLITDVQVNNTPTTCGINNGAINVTNIVGGTPGFTYSLNGQSPTTIDTYNNLSSAAYTLTVTDSEGCTYSLNNIDIAPSSGILDINKTIKAPICGKSDGVITIDNVNGGLPQYTYELNNSFDNIGVFNDLSSGDYNLLITDAQGCTYSETIALISLNTTDTLTIPNVITANNDLINDFWSINADCVESFECTILNRWGNLVYTYEDINGYWNGKDLQGNEVNEGVYFYNLNIKYFGSETENHHGFIHVVK